MTSKEKVQAAHRRIKSVLRDEAAHLTINEYHCLLEELLADADGWKMLIDEDNGEADADED